MVQSIICGLKDVTSAFSFSLSFVPSGTRVRYSATHRTNAKEEKKADVASISPQTTYATPAFGGLLFYTGYIVPPCAQMGQLTFLP